jgi:Zn-dependent protease
VAKPWLAEMLFVSVWMNFALAIFNMLPIPPLDGSKCLAGLLPDALAFPYLRLGRFGFVILIAIVLLLPLIGQAMGSQFNPFWEAVWRPAYWLTQHFLNALGLRILA